MKPLYYNDVTLEGLSSRYREGRNLKSVSKHIKISTERKVQSSYLTSPPFLMEP